MHLDRSLPPVAALAPQNFDNITRHIDPEWVEQALQATGTASVRTRRFPAELAMWLPIGMAMVRDRPIVEVVDSLGLVLPAADAKPKLVARSTVHQAGKRKRASNYVTAAPSASVTALIGGSGTLGDRWR